MGGSESGAQTLQQSFDSDFQLTKTQSVNNFRAGLNVGPCHGKVFRLGLIFSCLVLSALTQSVAAAQEISLTPQAANELDWMVDSSGILDLTTTGRDPFVVFTVPDVLNVAETPVLEMEYFAASRVEGPEVRLGHRNRWRLTVPVAALPTAQTFVSWSTEVVVNNKSESKLNGLSQLRIDFGNDSGRRLQIRRLRFRELSSAEMAERLQRKAVRRRKVEEAEQLRHRWNIDRWEGRLVSVEVQDQSITVSGRAPTSGGTSNSGGRLRLCGFEFADSVDRADEAIVERSVDVGQDGVFSMSLPRYSERTGRDHAETRFRLFRQGGTGKWIPASHVMYATTVDSRHPLPAPPDLMNSKGMGGIMSHGPFSELVELGIRHMTVNVVATDLLSAEKQPGSIPFDHQGRRWWFRESRLAGTDRVVRFATDHSIVVAAIILLPARSADVIGHPEASGHGIYDMPNFTDTEAAEKYSAALKLLAKRYNGQADSRGRIDHWIMHNEVDFGWTWTNMGEQPIELFLDHYVRSMRLMWLHAIQQNPHAKVFISLTHHWHKPKPSDWRTYGPRQLLELLATMTAVEGDFDWGVAYHPYPQSLFRPDTWNDTRVSDEFDSPLITMKNIHVLKRFLQQPEFLDRRQQLRPVLLSEQGYHTDGNSKESQKVQAAALLYTWDRLRATDFVMAYDYHRWVDHPREGGLLVGLRSLPTSTHPFGRKKYGWEVMKAIDTDRESEYRADGGPVDIYRKAGTP